MWNNLDLEDKTDYRAMRGFGRKNIRGCVKECKGHWIFKFKFDPKKVDYALLDTRQNTNPSVILWNDAKDSGERIPGEGTVTVCITDRDHGFESMKREGYLDLVEQVVAGTGVDVSKLTQISHED